MKQVAGTLRLELAQYRELASFAQFGTDLDNESKKRLEKGKRLVEILQQEQYKPMSVEKQIMILYAGVNDYLMDVPVNKIKKFEKEFLDYMDTHHRDIGKQILEEKQLSDEIKEKLNASIEEFKKYL
jgi:F-type H+-transporting ATPase subunit alpha